MLTGGREGQQIPLIAAEARAPENSDHLAFCSCRKSMKVIPNFLTEGFWKNQNLKPGYNHGLARPPMSGESNYSEIPKGLPWSESIRYPPNYNRVEAAPYYYHAE